MADIKTIFLDFSQGVDVALQGLLLAQDDGLTTAIILSLFTDARAGDDDVLPHNTTDRRGWWADAFPVAAGDKIGSRRWLVPGKQTQDNMNRVREYDQDALAWLVKDKVADEVVVETSNPRDGVLSEFITIVKPDGSKLAYRFETLWSNA